LAACTTARTAPPAQPAPLVYPAVSWERVADPEAASWSSDGLEAVRARLATMSTTGFMAVAGGRVLMEYGDIERVSYLASVRKSVLSMLYGIYLERGSIDLDRTLDDLGIDDIGGLTPAEKQATVRDLITARSGIYHEASNGGDDLARAPPRGSQRPGGYYLYSNWDFNALGTIFEQQTGVGIYDALERDLARPLGMEDFDRASHRMSGDSTKSTHLAYHMHLSTRDMARIGYLMLREGRWADRQIVPRAWVHESTRAFTRREEMNPAPRRTGRFGYGYLWWVFDDPALPEAYRGAYTGLGAVGQHILVMPRLDLVVVHKTVPGEGRRVSHDQFLEVVALLVEAHCGPDCRSAIGQGPTRRNVTMDSARAAALYVSDRHTDHPVANYQGHIRQKAQTDSIFEARSRGVLDYRKIAYRSSAGDMDIPAYVYQPLQKRGSRGHPALIWVHGGVHGNWTPNYWPFIREAVERGYVVIAPEYRGSTGYGPAHHNAIDYGGLEVEDAASAYDWMRENLPHVDPERVGIMGWSHGAFISILAVTREDHPFRAAAAIVPVTNLFFRLSYKGPRYQRSFSTQERVQGLPFEQREIYKERSPYYQVEKLEVPLLVHIATNDTDVNFEEAEPLIYKLNVLKPHLAETKIYVDPAPWGSSGGHAFSRRVDRETLERVDSPAQIDSWNRTWAFLEEHLRPYEDPSRPASSTGDAR
jgi:CubicO group peptidase (beta-lactamase class C family)/dienelactone hydrolase